jgi:glucokinase
MSTMTRRALVGDIGATHARFGLVDLADLTIGQVASFDCAAFESLDQVLGAYLQSLEDYPAAVSLAVAGPVADGTVDMTHLPWSVTRQAVVACTGADTVCLINDCEAVALSLPHLRAGETDQIGGTAALAGAHKVVCGPGTGLGVAALAWTGHGWTALSGEGGHAAFAAQTEQEFDIVRKIVRDIGYISYEHMLSASGLVRLYRLLAGGPGQSLTVPEIVRKATGEGDAAALQALRLYATWLGRFAGDLALLYNARGGVYLGGGIVPHILSFLTDGRFRAAFESKGHLSEYLADIPAFVIRSPLAGMTGAALALSTMLEAAT